MSQDDAFDGDQGTQFVWEGNTVASNGHNNQFTPSSITNQRPVSDFDYNIVRIIDSIHVFKTNIVD